MKKRWSWTRCLVALALTLFAQRADADVDSFGFGDGHDHDLEIDGQLVVNVYGVLETSARAGDTELSIVMDGPLGNALVMLVQTRSPGLDPPTACDVGTYDLMPGGVGTFELARVSSAEDAAGGARRALLEHPLRRGFTSPGTQIVLVREYMSVRVRSGAAIVSAPYDGEKGGVVAFLVDGELRNDGFIDVSGAGFRGGIYVDESAATCPELNDVVSGMCMAGDEPSPRGAARGESLANDRTGGQTGFFANLSGGGGGVCHNAGGGGGGHHSAGGVGGSSLASVDGSANAVGGCGGRALDYEIATHLVFGGGGGSGQANSCAGSNGGRGGGAVWIRAHEVKGVGTFRANGETVVAPIARVDGQGGGGAGGVIALRARGEIECSSIEAHGGDGGDSYSDSAGARGPGGGGGAGRVLARAFEIDCETRASGGMGGLAYETDRNNGTAHDATNGVIPLAGNTNRIERPYDRPGSPIVEDEDACTASFRVTPGRDDEYVIVFSERDEVARSSRPGESVEIGPTISDPRDIQFRIYEYTLDDGLSFSEPVVLTFTIGNCDADAGMPDAGEDAGEDDAGEDDSAVDEDSASEDAEVPDRSLLFEVRGGGLCSVNGGSGRSWAPFLALAAITLFVRRKRANRERARQPRAPTDA